MDNLDFRSIKVLLNLYKTRNTYVTAEQLDLSQSAVARILAKCRQSFNEPLFIRTGNQLSPTAFTDALVEMLPELLNGIEEVVATRSEFDPKKLSGHYQIYLNRQTQLIYGERLFKILSRDAPNASWYIKGWDHTSVEQMLDDRAVIGVNYFSPALPNSIIQETLTDDELCILAHEDHPLHDLEQVSIDDLQQYEFVSLAIPYIDERNLYTDAMLQELGVKARIQLQTDSIMLGIQVAENDGLLLLTSVHVARYPHTHLKPINFTIDPKSAPDSRVVLSYARKNRDKPLIRWFKKAIAETASDAFKINFK